MLTLDLRSERYDKSITAITQELKSLRSLGSPSHRVVFSQSARCDAHNSAKKDI